MLLFSNIWFSQLISPLQPNTAFLIYIKHVPCLGWRLEIKILTLIQKSITFTTFLRIKPSQIRKVDFFNCMPLLPGEQVLLQHILVHMFWEALQVFGNKQFLGHTPVKWVPLEWLMLESLVVADSPAVQILCHVLCV